MFCSLPDDLVVDILDHIVAVLNVSCCDDGGMCVYALRGFVIPVHNNRDNCGLMVCPVLAANFLQVSVWVIH